MLGAIIGDIVGSRFEFNNTSDVNFELFTSECSYTDDTICTIAIADAICNGKEYGNSLREWCRRYPNPKGDYGGSFARWILSANPQPYNSFGNGSAMRVSSVGLWYGTLEDVQLEAEKTAIPTHNHIEGVKGAVVTAIAIFIARKYGKEKMLEKAREFYEFKLPDFGTNPFDETCQGTMPVVFGILEKANSFEEAIRYAVAVGGDSDTICAIVGSMSEVIWGVPIEMVRKATKFLTEEMCEVIEMFYNELERKRNE